MGVEHKVRGPELVLARQRLESVALDTLENVKESIKFWTFLTYFSYIFQHFLLTET